MLKCNEVKVEVEVGQVEELKEEVVSLSTLLNRSRRSVLIPVHTQAVPARISAKWHFYFRVSTFTLGYRDTILGTSEPTNTIAAITIQPTLTYCTCQHGISTLSFYVWARIQNGHIQNSQ